MQHPLCATELPLPPVPSGIRRYCQMMLGIQVMLDSNGFDTVVDAGALELVRGAMADGHLRITVTHVQLDELRAIPDDNRRRAIAPLVQLVELADGVVATAGAIWGVSRWGQATWSSPSDAEVIDGVAGHGLKHARDALILSTAKTNGSTLVTADKRLISQAANFGVPTMTASELMGQLADR